MSIIKKDIIEIHKNQNKKHKKLFFKKTKDIFSIT